MQLHVCNDYAQMSSFAADHVIRDMSAIANPLFCPASGSTPVGLYTELVTLYRNKAYDPNRWLFISLDEWVGMNGTSEGSCRHSLDQQLLDPLNVDEGRIRFFDGKSNDLASQCAAADEFLKSYGPITVAVVGVGMNGHIGFNEPGVSPDLSSHVVQLDQVTKEVGRKYFDEQPVLDRGITLGFKSLLNAQTVILLASGQSKARIVKKFFDSEVDPLLPATILKQHQNFHVYLDKDCASLLG